MKQPNILYFVCHDLGQHLGCYGARVSSPNLDKFAAQSAVFENAFCNSPACSPSRSCAMSGMYAHNNGGIGLSHMGWPLPQSVDTVTEFLGRAGYETIHSGVAHERIPETNHYEVELEEEWEDWQAHNAIGKAIDYLERRDRDRPFYLNIGTQQVHASTWHRQDLHGDPTPPEDVWVPLYSRDTPHLREEFGKFQATIDFLDQNWQKLMDALDRLDYTRDTVIIFTTDHGIANPRSKGTLYERGVEIALIVRMPGCEGAGRRFTEMVQNIDFLPTCCEAAGAPIPDQAQGKSFWPLLEGRTGNYQPHDAVFIERNFHGESSRSLEDPYEDVYDPSRAIRTPEFHYIRWFRPSIHPQAPIPWTGGGPRPHEELYDLRHDPQEFVNVADRPEYRRIKETLAGRLQKWMEDTEDFVLTGDVPKRPQEPGWGAWQE